jgi:hypothetical protein
VCVHYSAHWCAYKKVFNSDLDSENPLMDAARMAWFADHIVFDDDRDVVSVPARDEVLAAFRSMPTQQKPLPVAEPDPVIDEWRSIVLSDRASITHPSPHRYEDSEVSHPCDGCQAWCCKYLVFDRDTPRNYEELEFLRFSLGFPNVEIAVTERNWSLLIRTTCRHLVDNRCSVYGTDQRPLKCGYYSALKCSYRTDLGVPRPEYMVRMRREHFEAVVESVAFDDLGQVVAIPSVDLIRARIESAERARADIATDRDATH